MRVEAEKTKIEVEKARDEAEQHGYDVGVTKAEKAKIEAKKARDKAEVPAVC